LFIAGTEDLSVGVEDEPPAIVMPLPLGNQLHVNVRLPQALNQALAQVSLGEARGILQPLAGAT
jgi:hypothetical protein